jgi:anti-sigma regulatory factor (Ser/Thr protein kinase)
MPMGDGEEMPTNGAALRHNAFVYASEDEYRLHSVAFLREGLEAGEGAIVAHTRPGISLMREALGSDAGRVTFVDVSESYTRPTRTLAAYHRVYAEQLAKAPQLRAVADVQFGPDRSEWDLWTGYEAIFNRSFGHLPVWIWCTYASRLPDPMLDAVWRTHPEVLAEDAWSRSEQFEDPIELLRRVTPAPFELADLRSIEVGSSPEDFRERVAAELWAANVSEAKVLDMLVAATEVFENAVQHGGGVKDVRVGRVEGRFVCEVVDVGRGFDDPGVGYLAPREGIGAGMWVARQLTWDIEFFDSLRGFTCRIRL